MTPAAERRPLLPFAWARAHHLVLLSDGERCEALCRSDTAARRCWKRVAWRTDR